MTEENSAQPVHALMAEVLARRADPRSGAWMASVRKAITPSTEVAAYAATERHLASLPERARVGARRAAAICASSPGVPDTRQALGRSFAALARKATSGSIDARMNTLPLLDVENAAQVFLALVRLCGEHHVAVSFRALGDTLAWWGDGLSPASQRTRQRLLADYYAAPLPEPVQPEGTIQ